MKIRSESPLLTDTIRAAHLSTESSQSSYGQPVLILDDDGTVLGIEDVMLSGYQLIEASPEERESLEGAGYHLPTA